MTTTLVTGGSRGIGLELCRQLAARGDQVIATARRPGDELDALGVRVEADIDVADDGAAEEIARRLRGVTLDLVVHNAGILTSEGLDDLDVEAVRRQIEVNAIAPLRITRALRPNLRRGSKVVIISSVMGSIGENESGGYYGYRMSKAAVNMAGANLAIDLRPDGVAVGILHPGYVRTEMNSGRGAISAEESARAVIARIDGLALGTTGQFWHADGHPLPW